MPRPPSANPPSLLTALKAESASLALEIAAKAERKQQVDALITTYEGDTSIPTKKPRAFHPRTREALKSKLKSAPVDGPFYGLALPEAVAKALVLAGEARLPREVWDVLKNAGFKTTSNDPVNAVFWALRRRERVRGDVALVGGGRWALKDWYTEEKLQELRKSLGKMGGRDREAHIEKTRKGIAARRENGVHWGAQVKVTDDVRATFVRLVLDEGKSVKDAATQLGLATSTYYSRQTKDGLSVLDAVNKAKQERGITSRRKRKKSAKEVSPDLLTPVAGNA